MFDVDVVEAQNHAVADKGGEVGAAGVVELVVADDDIAGFAGDRDGAVGHALVVDAIDREGAAVLAEALFEVVVRAGPDGEIAHVRFG